MPLKTTTPQEIVTRRGKANLFEVFQIVIDTPPGTTSVIVRRRGVLVDDVGTRQEIVPIGDRVLAGDPLTAAMADAARRLFAAVRVDVPAQLTDKQLAGALYAGIRDAVYADAKAELVFPRDATVAADTMIATGESPS
jgi:hypothetical protein